MSAQKNILQGPVIDLHMHTTVSDGTDLPEEIPAKVKEHGIRLFSITDHDAIKAALIVPPLLKEGDPDFITGVEFSCKDELGKYHILGYGYDPRQSSINETVQKGHNLRMKKVHARLDFLKERFGFSFPQGELNKLLTQDNPGKPHIANLMVKYGYAKTKEKAILDYINQVHFHSEYVRPEEAIAGILGSGGIPILAHPAYGSGDQLILGAEMEERLVRLMGFGLKGLESFYSGFTPKITNEMLGLAEKYGLYVTAGSDYHGRNKLITLGDNGLSEDTVYPEGLKRFLEDVRRHEV